MSREGQNKERDKEHNSYSSEVCCERDLGQSAPRKSSCNPEGGWFSLPHLG